MEFMDQFLEGDCETILRDFPDNSVDLIFTSPPYADQRQRTYGGISPDHYVDWFLPKAAQFLRVLKPTGTFVLNIKERVVDGERHTYVIELILRMREQGWLWTEEFMWHKKNSYPGKWPNRFRDNWERLIQFNKQKQFNMYQEAVMVPVGEWAKERLAKLSETDKTRDESKVGSGFGKNVSNWLGRPLVYPTNVLHWQQNAPIATTAPLFRRHCPNGSSGSSHSLAMSFWIPSQGLAARPWRPGNSAGNLSESILTLATWKWHANSVYEDREQMRFPRIAENRPGCSFGQKRRAYAAREAHE